MSAYLMQEIAAMHEADLRHEAERERLIRQAKDARGQHGHIDFVGVVLNALGVKGGGVRPAMNPGH
jgi:hypothetical protein